MRFIHAMLCAFFIVGAAVNFEEASNHHRCPSSWWSVFHLLVSALFLTWAVIEAINAVLHKPKK